MSEASESVDRAIFERCPRRLIAGQECCGTTHLSKKANFARQHNSDRVAIDTIGSINSNPVSRFAKNRIFAALKSDPRRWVSEVVFNPELSKFLHGALITPDTRTRLERALNGTSVSTSKLPDCPLKNLRV